MATVLFITPNDLKQNTILNGNVDTDLFIQYIKIAQQMHIQNYLGTHLYNKFTYFIENDLIGPDDATDYYNLLIDYIQPMLIHFSMIDYLPFANYQIRNGGVFKHKTENSESTTKDELDILVQKHRTFADFYAKRFVDYMGIYASSMFPEYWQNRNADMFPDRNPSPVNWVL
jgi:hypothetical protein